MNYELAKQLKDAGFRMLLTPYEKGDALYFGRQTEFFDGESYLIPTLEELMEACGDKMQTLWKYEETWYAANWNGGYITDDVVDASFPLNKGAGTTPTEAVAKLWLALTNK